MVVPNQGCQVEVCTQVFRPRVSSRLLVWSSKFRRSHPLTRCRYKNLILIALEDDQEMSCLWNTITPKSQETSLNEDCSIHRPRTRLCSSWPDWPCRPNMGTTTKTNTIPSLKTIYLNSRSIYKFVTNRYFLGPRSRSGSMASNTGSFHGDGSDPSDAGRGNLLSAEELSNLIVHRSPKPRRGVYPSRATVSSTLDSCSDYVTLPPPPIPPPPPPPRTPPRRTDSQRQENKLSPSANSQGYVLVDSSPSKLQSRDFYYSQVRPILTHEAQYSHVSNRRQQQLSGCSGLLPTAAIPATPSSTDSSSPPFKTAPTTPSKVCQPGNRVHQSGNCSFAIIFGRSADCYPWLFLCSCRCSLCYCRSTPNVAVASGFVPLYNKHHLAHSKFASNQNLSSDYYGYPAHAPTYLSSGSPLYSAATSYSSSSTHSLRYEPLHPLLPPHVAPLPASSSFHRTLSDDNILNIERPAENSRLAHRRPPPPPIPHCEMMVSILT
ncbi:unnamed protein product [Nesidiocoris tenuis]|uniref:Uncharacterized protein n=1 Tax=Nesidiocoris tenuis TaxID=355587 RepID=A0A6H5GQ21_9HEMI|nr:unnamed protein product [Nesidiocoris tenuis]